MKYKLLLGALSLCLLCNDAAFGSRKKPAVPTPKAKSIAKTSVQPLTGLQQFGLFDQLPNTTSHPNSKKILDILSKSTDPEAGDAIRVLGELLNRVETQQQTESLNAILSRRNVELTKETGEIKAQLEELQKKQAKFRAEITKKSDEAKDKNDQLKKENDQLQTQLGIARKGKEALEAKFKADLDAQRKQFEITIAEAQEELDKLKTTMGEGALGQIDRLTKEKTDLQTQIEQLKKEYEATLQKMAEENQNKTAELQKENESLSVSQQALRANAEKLKSTIHEKETDKIKLQMEVKKLQKRYDEFKDKLPQLRFQAIEEQLDTQGKIAQKGLGAALMTLGTWGPHYAIYPFILSTAITKPGSVATVRQGVLAPNGKVLSLSVCLREQLIGLENPGPITPKEREFMEFFFKNYKDPKNHPELQNRFFSLGIPPDRLAINQVESFNGQDVSLSLCALIKSEEGTDMMREITQSEGSYVFEAEEPLKQPHTPIWGNLSEPTGNLLKVPGLWTRFSKKAAGAQLTSPTKLLMLRDFLSSLSEDLLKEANELLEDPTWTKEKHQKYNHLNSKDKEQLLFIPAFRKTGHPPVFCLNMGNGFVMELDSGVITHMAEPIS